MIIDAFGRPRWLTYECESHRRSGHIVALGNAFDLATTRGRQIALTEFLKTPGRSTCMRPMRLLLCRGLEHSLDREHSN